MSKPKAYRFRKARAQGMPFRIEYVATNTSKELIFLVPADLPSGAYRLEVRARFGKHLRSGQLRDILAVA